MPEFLAKGGNASAWKSVAEAICSRSAALLLHGPHGCGKTRGVHELAKRHLGLTVYEINPGNTSGTDAFMRDARHVSRSKTLLGPRVLLIDDIEGFDEAYISKAAEYLRDWKATDGAVVLTCNNPFDRRLLKLRSLQLARVRFYAPGPQHMISVLRCLTAFPTSSGVAQKYAREANGNYHQLLIKVCTHANSCPDERVGLFETTDALLRRKATVQDWVRSAETPVLVSLLHENSIQLSQVGRSETESMERISRFLDNLSATERYGENMRLEVVGGAARLLLSVQRTPSLRLPKRAYERGVSFDPDMPTALKALSDTTRACAHRQGQWRAL
jgi:hypothetical protein